MLNFDPELIFVRPIKIIDLDELARIREPVADDSTSSAISILSDKKKYSTREKITLSIDVLNDLDMSVPSTLSVSVTDYEQAVPAPNETTILSDFSIPSIQYPDTLDRNTRYRIQNGFDLKGVFVTSKNKPDQGMITLVQEDTNMDIVFTTEPDGNFFLPNLLFYDSVKLSYVAKTVKGKVGKAIFDTLTISPPVRTAKPLQIDIYKTDKPTRHHIPDFSDQARMLEEVTVKATRIENKKPSMAMADYVVTGDWIRERNFTDVLTSLQVKIPGLRIFIVNRNGFPSKVISLGSPSSFGGAKSVEPLVLIDQVVVNDLPGGVAEQIENLRPVEIESIEVSRFGGSAVYGARGGNGVISIKTSRGNSEGSSIGVTAYDKSMLKPFHAKGFSTTRKFRSPDYSDLEKSANLPDYRSTIYWNPALATDGKKPVEISFFAADLATRYRIVVEGVTRDGNAVRREKIITIEKLP